MARTISFHPHGSLDGPRLGGWSAEGSIAFSTTPSATEFCGTLAFSSSCSKPPSRCPDKHHCISVPVGPNGYGSLHRALVGCAGCPHVWEVSKGDVAQKEGGAQDSRGHEVGGAEGDCWSPWSCVLTVPCLSRGSYLDELSVAGECAAEYLALYQKLITSAHWKVYLAARGVLPYVGNLITKVAAPCPGESFPHSALTTVP